MDSEARCTGDLRRFKALVVTRDDELREQASSVLEARCQSVIKAEAAAEALRLLTDNDPDIVVLDICEAGRNEMQLLRVSKEVVPWAKVLALACPEEMDKAVTAVKRGAFDCLPKPLNPEGFDAAVRRAIREIERWAQPDHTHGRLGYWSNGKALVGQSKAIEDVWEKIEMVRDVTSNVLIQGDTGTGKELIAYAIHDSSPRADGPFVKLNCGAIPKDLLESELFGHEKGSFTGALQQRIGRFEMADGGTILLDEIGDMPLELQVKLLGVLQDRFVQRVGGHEKIPVDVRIIAATHQDLPHAIKEKRFREDLYYRLNVITINVPPLRERRDDIPLLVDYFTELYTRQTGRNVKGVDEDAMKILMTHDYPGNVRELENIIESAVVLCMGDYISPRELPRDLAERSGGNDIVVRPGMSLSEIERLCIIETLRYTGGNKQRAAEMLGITPRSIYRKIERYEISLDPLIK